MIAVRSKETKPKRCKNVDQKLVCRYNDCEFVARSKTGLIHHERVHRNKPTFTCSKCERTFGTKSSHTNHVKSCQSGGRVVKVGLPKVPCHICGYIGTKTNLSRHKKKQCTEFSAPRLVLALFYSILLLFLCMRELTLTGYQLIMGITPLIVKQPI